MAKQKRKSPEAAAMARKRWKGIPKAERSRLMRDVVNIRWEEKRKKEEAARANAA